MADIGFDFETKSEHDLTKVGSMKYLHGRDADIVCLSYCIDDLPVKLWTPQIDVPYEFKNPQQHTWYAFNAQFDWRVWNFLGTNYGFSKLKLDYLRDVMAICGRFTYPQKLETVGAVLDLRVQKNRAGKALMKKICSPPYRYTHQELFDFYDYCKDDTDTMRELLKALPASQLSKHEQKIWKLTAKMNARGLPIDIKAVKQIRKVTETYKEAMSEQLPEMSDGAITKVTQGKRIVKWLQQRGVRLNNLQAKTVETLLERTDLDEDSRTMLELRQELGKSSTAKYLKLMEQEFYSFIYDNLRYYGANTGRWAGLGFQLHNLPRSKVKDAQPFVDKFFDLSIIDDNPVDAAKSIIRGMIYAPDDYLLAFSDYSSVENRILAWVAGDEETLERFRQGFDQYVDMAAWVYNVAYEDVTDDQRQFGKMIILGCGFGLGDEGFQGNAAGWGVYLTLTQAKEAVKSYRSKYKLIVRFWYKCSNAAKAAIRNPGYRYDVGMCQFKVIKDRNEDFWLMLTLPSGRALYYKDPEVRPGKYGNVATHMGFSYHMWRRNEIIPGRFAENIVQATARDLLAEGKINLDEAGYHLIGSIHDETISLVKENQKDCINDINRLMCINPDWALDLPLEADGVVERRYRKM